MSKGINMLKTNNKSSNVVQLNNSLSVTSNTGTYVNIGVTTHAQYNNDVSMLKGKYLFDTENNICLFNVIDETIDLSTFVIIGQEPIISGCITIQDIFNFYTNGVIQGFYENFCQSHSANESIVLAKFLSTIGIEVWRSVTCYGGIYKGRYFVSNLGRVLSLNKKHFGKIVKTFDNGHGYLRVQLYHNGNWQNISVHRLVALTFYNEEPTEKVACCHGNTVKTDNRLFNLKLGTYSENMNNPITRKKYRNTIDNRTKAKADKDTAAAATSTASTESTPTATESAAATV